MKYQYFLIVAIFLSVNTSFGQQAKLGLKSGMNLADLSGTVNVDTKAKPGMVLGAYLQAPFTDRTFFHPEIQFSVQGSQYERSRRVDNTYITEETKVKLNYLNVVPLCVKFYLTESKNVNLLAGTQVGFLLSAREVGVIRGDDVDEDISEDFKSMDFAVLAGLGMDLPFGLNFGARLNYGISDISSLSKDYTQGFTRPNLTNVVFQFHVGYTFGKDE